MYLLLRAPPWSQSHGLQPSMSLDRPQCCGYREKKRDLFIHTHIYIYRGKISKLRPTVKFGSAPDTDRSYIRQRGACRSNFLCLNRRSFLQAEFPAGYSYKLPKNPTTKQWSNMIQPRQADALCVFVTSTYNQYFWYYTQQKQKCETKNL